MSDNIIKVCRLCLAEVEVACPIFGNRSNGGVDLPKRIMSCAQIKVAEGDGLPTLICQQCMAQVDISFQFRLQCEKSDAELRKALLQFAQKVENCNKADVPTAFKLKKETEHSYSSLESDHGASLDFSSGNFGDHNGSVNGTEHTDDDDEVSTSSADEKDAHGCLEVPPLGLGDSESADGWEVMKFTPEVIINEEDSKGSGEGGENGSLIPRNMNSLVEQQQLYQLSQVEAILRNHGTEIKVQGAVSQILNQKRPSVPAASINGDPRSLASPVHKIAIGVEMNGLRDDYFAMYNAETALNNDDESGASGAKSRRTHNGEKLFKCRLCPKSYSFSSALSRHKAVHNTMLRPYVCPVCKKGFAEPEKLERHSRTHLVDRTWSCNNCGRVFKALSTYERHITTVCSYRNKENGGGIVSLPPGLTAHAVNLMPQTIMFRNS